MQSTSTVYFVFAAAVFFLYWSSTASRKLRLAVILGANYLFCARFGVFYAFLIPSCSTIDYMIGIGLQQWKNRWMRRFLLGVSVLLNLALLIGSKHMGLLLNGYSTHLSRGSDWDWIFPLGLSFYTFQSLTYTIDIYRRDAEPTRSLLAHLCSASFFPTILAGPITRVSDLISQFEKRPALGSADGGRALFLIGFGLLKKLLIADYLAENLVNRVFDTPNLYSGAEALIAVYAYSLQLYYDFSGYTDIARGTAALFGVRLPLNFDRPYSSLNVAEFWKRWHISFSKWLQEYLYFSLPGKRTKVMPYINLVVTMVLGGLWHGLTLPFAIWGLLHGVALAIVRGFQAKRGRARQPISFAKRALCVFVTYHFVCFTWIFFRASSYAEAMTVISRIASLTTGVDNVSGVLLGVILLAAIGQVLANRWYKPVLEAFAVRPFYVHAAGLLLVVLALEFFGGKGSAPFVYSKF